MKKDGFGRDIPDCLTDEEVERAVFKEGFEAGAKALALKLMPGYKFSPWDAKDQMWCDYWYDKWKK